MATNLKTVTDNDIENGAAAGHNSEARQQIIAKAMDKVAALERQKKKLNEEIREAKGPVKELGVTMNAFNGMLAVRELDEEVDRNKQLDSIRECYAAAGFGFQGDMFPAQPAST